MTTSHDQSLTKFQPVHQETGRTWSVPTFLVERYRSRIRAVTLTVLVIMLFGWFLAQVLEGELRHELSVPHEWGPPTLAIVVSVILLGMTYSGLSIKAMVMWALAYEVVVSYAVAFASYWGAWRGVEAWQVNGDLVGVNGVALFLVFFTILVPVPPARALMALVPGAAAIPVVYLLSVAAGQAPRLETQPFLFVFVWPYAVTAILATMASGVIYRLGEEVHEAREMGSYRLERLLGRGGMGEVWLASHRLLARPAAVKVITREALGHHPEAVQAVIARFEREAHATAHLRSPHTVELYDYGTSEDGAVYYVMEYLEGVDLERLIAEDGPQPAERVVHILRQACASLAEAHDFDLVHRDIKPANIYLCRQAREYDFVKVLDFGLVKQPTAIPKAGDAAVSQAGLVMGTPAYMPPEIALQHDPIDGRADLYALACVGYWLLTGTPVFTAATPNATMFAHVDTPPEPPSSRTDRPIPPELERLLLSCLAKDPDHRPRNAEVLTAALEGIPLAEPWTRERARAWWQHRTT